MIIEITNWILAYIQSHGPTAVFIGVLLESVIVPIPSPIIIMGAGALLIPVDLTASEVLFKIIFIIVLPGAVASTIGAFVTFGVTYLGGKPLIERFKKFLGFDWADVLWVEKKLEKREAFMIFWLRALPVVPLSLISAAAGVLRLPIVPFTIWTFFGSIPRNLILGYLGYYTRDSFRGLAKGISSMDSIKGTAKLITSLESIVSISIMVGVVAAMVWLRMKVKGPTNKQLEKPGEDAGKNSRRSEDRQ